MAEEKREDKFDWNSSKMQEMWAMKALKGARVSWYTWNSPVGLGLFFIEIAACFWLLHLANVIH